MDAQTCHMSEATKCVLFVDVSLVLLQYYGGGGIWLCTSTGIDV